MTDPVANHMSSASLLAYLDGTLAGPESAAAKTHLASCPRCSRALESLKEFEALARSIPAEKAGTDLVRSIMLRVGISPHQSLFVRGHVRRRRNPSCGLHLDGHGLDVGLVECLRVRCRSVRCGWIGRRPGEPIAHGFRHPAVSRAVCERTPPGDRTRAGPDGHRTPGSTPHIEDDAAGAMRHRAVGAGLRVAPDEVRVTCSPLRHWLWHTPDRVLLP